MRIDNSSLGFHVTLATVEFCELAICGKVVSKFFDSLDVFSVTESLGTLFKLDCGALGAVVLVHVFIKKELVAFWTRKLKRL